MENTNTKENCGLSEVINGGLSKNQERNVKALKLCEENFKVRCEERGLKKGDKAFDEFRREYNGCLKTKLELVAKGMEPGRASDRINYANPEKDRGAVRGGYRPDSAIWKAHEFIRLGRMDSFRKSHKEGLLPSEVELSDKIWMEIALALFVVPAKYRVTTDGGNLVHNKETAEAFLEDWKADITANRLEVSEAMEAAERERMNQESPKPEKKRKAA